MERKEEVKFGGAATSLPADLSCLQGGGGGGGGGAELATLEKQLICPICLELFNKPVVILPCQHNLCRKCANELYQPSLFQARTTMLVNSGRFRCPSCRHEVVLDRHGVYGLQRNLLVENIIDVYKQEISNNNNTTSPLPPPPAQPTCSDHEGEKVNIYCLTCQVPTCSLCKVFGAHQSCQVAPLTDVYQQQKDVLSGEVSSLVVVNDKIQGVINELEETCRNIEENCETQKQRVCEKFDRVFSILEERRKAMTQRIIAEQEEKTGHVQALVRCYGESVEANSKLVERAGSSMEEPDMAAFVQNSRELITKVLTATSSCPAEALKPGYESLSHYSFNFSRQERALKSIDFLKVVEDVPEEPEVEQEPEEPKEPSVQNTEPKHHQETSTQNLKSVVEPVKEPIPAPISPPVEPVQTAAPTSAPVPPAPGLVTDSVQPAGVVLRPETDDPDLNYVRSGLMKNKEKEKEKEEAEGCAAPDPVKDQGGMSTQQCEGGEAEGDAGDWTAQSETEEEHDAQDEEEEEEMQMKQEIHAAFYPSWYKPNSWRRIRPVPEEILEKVDDTEHTMCSPQSQSQPQKVSVEPGSAFTPGPQSQETEGKAGITEEENEEEVDMQGWVCLPAAVDKGFSLVEGRIDLAEGSLDSFSDNNESPLSIPPEDTRSGLERGSSEMDKVNFELSDGRVEDADEKGDNLDLKCASELKEGGLEEGDFEAEMMKGLEEGSVQSDERSKVQGYDISGLEDTLAMREDRSKPNNDSSDAGDDGAEIRGSGDAEFEASSSGYGENGEQPEAKSVGETEEKITSSVSLQAVTLLFYLLAFLVILQRVWAYIGCFICT